MIRLNHLYAPTFFNTVLDGSLVNADVLPTAVLYRNGVVTAIPVIVSNVSTGLYQFIFTTLGEGDGWSESDRLTVLVTATIDGRTYSSWKLDTIDQPIPSEASEGIEDILRLLSGGSILFNQAPVTPQGKIPGPIIIGDDYFDERAFVWYIDPEPGLISEYRVFFGGKSFQVGQWLVEGELTATTIEGEPKWELRHDMMSAVSSLLKPGTYSYAVSLVRNNTTKVTRAFGTVDAIKVFTNPNLNP